jgi:type I restriction enzyme S subunit
VTWSVRRIEHLASEVRETVDPAVFGDDEVDHFSIPALDATGQPERQPASEIQSNKQRLRGGEVLVSRLNPRKPRVLMAPPPDRRPALASGEFVVLRPTDVEPRFLEYLLRSETTRQQLDGSVQSVTRSHQRIRPEQLLKMPVRVPVSRQEQQAIAEFLDAETARIDALRAKKRQLIAVVRERFRASRASELAFDHFDPMTGSGAIPSGWSNVSLGVCIRLQRGHDLPEGERVSGEIPIVSSGGISGWHDTPAENGPGVVTGRYGTVGEVFMIEGPYWPLNTTLYVKDFRGTDPRWVRHLLATLPLDSESAKSAVTGINRNVIGMLRVPLPPRQQQSEIANRIDQGESRQRRLCDGLATQIDLLTEHRQALVTASVTGELDIPGVAA